MTHAAVEKVTGTSLVTDQRDHESVHHPDTLGGHQECGCAGFLVGFLFLLFGVFFASLTQARVIQEEKTSLEKMPPTDWPVRKSLGHFLD